MTDRIENFSVNRRGDLVRQVVPARGRPYEHRCTLKCFEEALWAAEGCGDNGFTLEELAACAAIPNTQAAVALALLKERGCVETHLRRNYPASRALFEDAMTEFYALAEGG